MRQVKLLYEVSVKGCETRVAVKAARIAGVLLDGKCDKGYQAV
jgi:hypothetical protein